MKQTTEKKKPYIGDIVGAYDGKIMTFVEYVRIRYIPKIVEILQEGNQEARGRSEEDYEGVQGHGRQAERG
jgi:hypothetical protein